MAYQAQPISICMSLTSTFSSLPVSSIASITERAIRKPDLWYHDGDHAVLMRSNLVCHDVHVDPIQPRMRPI
jgi:hypothetical protein